MIRRVENTVGFVRPVQISHEAAPRLRTASPAEADRSLARGTYPLGTESPRFESRSMESLMSTAIFASIMFGLIVASGSSIQRRIT